MRVALNASLDPESKMELQRLADANGIGVSAMLRVLIHRAIDSNQGDASGVKLPADGHCLIVWTAEDDAPIEPTAGELEAMRMRRLLRSAKGKSSPAKALAVRS